MRVEIEKKGGWAGGGKRGGSAGLAKKIFFFWAYSFEREYCVTIVFF